MEILTISDKKILIAHQARILKLFRACFGVHLPSEVWMWAYIDNPAGDPFVSLCYDDGELVGHYAVIPMPVASCSIRCNSFLSMTTMVSASHRKHGLFVILAKQTYAHIQRSGGDYVLGFPNAQSSPGFVKRLQWVIPETDFVARVSKEFLLKNMPGADADWANKFSIDFYDEEFRQWRLSKPGGLYVWDDGLAYKTFGDAIDLMYFDSLACLKRLPDDKLINVIVPASANLFREFKIFDYQFGGVSIGRDFSAEQIVRHMSLSDVF